MRIILAAAVLMSATPVFASSEDAWEEFRNEVKAACTALAPEGGETMIEVNPFGSDTYGAALIIHTINDDSAERYVCIFDKQTKKAEITAPFNPPEEVVETPEGEAVKDKTDMQLVE